MTNANKMSREIKFRAWDGRYMRSDFAVKNGVVIHEENPSSDSGVVTVETPDATSRYYAEWAMYRKKPEWVLMQFTGLQDLNERDIYEGDILKINECVDRGDGNHDDGLVKVYFEDGKYQVDGAIWADMSDWGIDFLVVGDFEIVGNIHENPELRDI